MNDLLRIQIWEASNGHRDLLVALAGFPALTLDTYYFSLATEASSSIMSAPHALAALLMHWVTAIERVTTDQSIYLPIDFSDQYTGCFNVYCSGDSLSLTYGLSKREGWSVNPLDPGDYCSTITDFQPSGVPVEFTKASLIFAIRQQLNTLQNLAF